MDNYGILSLLPPIIAIFLAIRTKQVFISLLTGIFIGWLIIGGWNPLKGILFTIDGIVNVFSDPGNTRVVIFTFLVGALITFIQVSGGVAGFINSAKNYFKTNENEIQKSRKKAQLFAALTGMLIFVESNISALTVGTIFRPIFDKLKLSREKLAYIADSTSAPSKLLIPFNGWGAFIMGLLLTQGIENPFMGLISAMPYNFYPILVIIILFIFIVSGKDIGPMKSAELRTYSSGNLCCECEFDVLAKDGVKPDRETGSIMREPDSSARIWYRHFLFTLVNKQDPEMGFKQNVIGSRIFIVQVNLQR